MAGLTEGREDYLEALLLEERERRVVRTKDLARRLGVKSPSVNAAVRELVNLGLARHESYGHIELTTAGRRKAAIVYSRHQTLYRFFADVLNVPANVSEESACGMEHHLDAAAVKRLARLLEFLEKKSGASGVFAAELREALGRD